MSSEHATDSVSTHDRCLAVVNGKGGVYKTSIVANVGGLAAAAGWQVLLVDLDPQGNLSEDLGLHESTDEGRGLTAAVVGGVPLTPAPTGRPGLDIVFGGDSTADLAGALRSRQASDPHTWAFAVANALQPIAGNYDLILIDCPPGDMLLQVAGLTAARHVVIPTRSDASSRKGLRKVAKHFVSVRAHNPMLNLLGVVRTGTSAGANAIKAEVKANLERDLGGVAPVTNTSVRYAEKAAVEARNRGQLPHELQPELAAQASYWVRRREGHENERVLPPSTAGLTADYAALTQELLDLMTAYEAVTDAAQEVRTDG